MDAGPMTNGLTNCTTGGEPAIHEHMYASNVNVVESARSAEPVEIAPSNPPVELNSDLNIDIAASLVTSDVTNVVTNIAANIDPNSHSSSDSWRVEVAARLDRYRTRRKPRTPRYPSLLLPFDAPESWSRPSPPRGQAAVATAPTAPAPSGQTYAFDMTAETAPVAALSYAAHHAAESLPAEPHPAQYPAKVIEFPRSAAIPVFRSSELADPIFDRPRIVEAPEILPPPPALGGMTIEAAHTESADRRAGADFPSASASASIFRRALATLVDGFVLAVALVAFAAIFLRLNPSLIPVRGPLAMLAGALAILLWSAYEFLFVVYTGSTPGMRAARLRLAAFDGSPLNRHSRRWRVLASFLSAFSAGLGYLWCLLDQDGLCWHDRITRTHVQPATPAE
jgi:uncharacterized RDD family membrane protein YckC